MDSSKDYFVKRHDILREAQVLFAQNGYEKTSVNAILNRVGIAKGTFYYYFNSKEEVLDAIIEEITDMAVARARQVASDASLSAIDKFLKVFLVMNVEEEVDSRLKETVHHSQHGIFYQKSLVQAIEKLTPILETIVSEGIEQGIFQADFPKQYIQIFLTSALSLFDGDVIMMTPTEKQEMTQALLCLGEKMFDLPAGSFSLADKISR
ncbi:TetR/AcrR family transcriptional regulator [Streptococcus pacificus]|uniref:TetR/AcrR family transcriptional regulator n=1 Tax=Streptococcus pacificus TaxID=2740577 RepID=A0ABS0ZHS0_9STRE|nr:TetR/AcrR family transcriptional regulator [Streptococcus pacificus]MBJ8325556.1 TetR/AcrR family transcriptional regulator [Streptococcus pacificus]